ncbi:SCP-like protein [Ancylostoma caninum]|uniref:SCP-like protein n=1 Tax=Ancylostoma caninum TaxID=29170 RepID=A0A368GZH7_ANCCA|nr:SCP-like protein [Ancylostoma caninum]
MELLPVLTTLPEKFIKKEFVELIGMSKKGESPVLFAILGVAHGNDGTSCSDDHGVDNEMRISFLDIHNGYRSLLARGRVSIDGGTSDAPKASKMSRLKYSCEAEEKAYESAKECKNASTNTNENVYVTADDPSKINIVLEAGNWWWSEVLDINQTAAKGLYYLDSSTGSFANMAWDSHKGLGCAVFNCSGGTHVVCHYTPQVRKLNESIYGVGTPCGGCPKRDCTPEEGLCD